MPKFIISFSVIVVATALSAAVYAAPPQKGAAAKGGAPHASSGSHSGGAAHAGVARGGGAHISARPVISHSSARSISHGNIARSTHRNTATRSSATRNTPSSSVSGQAQSNSTRNATRNTTRNSSTTQNSTSSAVPNANIRSNTVRNALSSRSVAGALRNTNALRSANTRASITASAATAGWHNGRGGSGWWRHSNGGYGWVGPLYWPFADYDIYGYAMWGNDDDSFWGYGYGDIYAGMFAPYGYDDLTGYMPQYASSNPSDLAPVSPASGTPTTANDQLAQMCGQDSRDIAGLPIDQFQQAIQPNDAQRAALDDLANASLKAAQDIKAACPSNIALTAPSRLAAMQQRIEAMIAAVATVQPPLEKFYDLLSDDQKEKLTALGQDQREKQALEKTTDPLAQTCGAAQPGVTEWPTAKIDQMVHPTEAQRVSLVSLQNATAKAADMLKASCRPDNALTPPARLTAVGKRLDTMLQAVETVRSALSDFYGSLSDEQKARFEAIGPQQTAQLDQPQATQANDRRSGFPGVGNVIRDLISIAR